MIRALRVVEFLFLSLGVFLSEGKERGRRGRRHGGKMEGWGETEGKKKYALFTDQHDVVGRTFAPTYLISSGRSNGIPKLTPMTTLTSGVTQRFHIRKPTYLIYLVGFPAESGNCAKSRQWPWKAPDPRTVLEGRATRSDAWTDPAD